MTEDQKQEFYKLVDAQHGQLMNMFAGGMSNILVNASEEEQHTLLSHFDTARLKVILENSTEKEFYEVCNVIKQIIKEREN